MSLPLDTKKVNQGRIFFSNRLEVLLELLIEEILSQDPLKTPKIIIPSREMGRWIRQQIADRLSVAANIQTLFLHEALQTALPSKLELTKAIYPKIAHLEYVKNDCKRQMLLAQTVAGFFQRYALYGVTFLSDWQKELWDSLGLQIDLTPKGSFHLFAFSHLPEKLFQAFSRSQFYHLSPCEEFWSDLTKYDHTLLGSCGKVGRKFAKMVEESHFFTAEYYLPPEGQTALQLLQNSMLQLEPLQIEADDSIQLHLVSTRRREIEVLHQTIRQMDVEPKDVLIMAPDIELYKPYIEAIFENYQIADMPAALNLQVRGLQLFLNLEKKRYSTLAFLELFRHPHFYRRWQESDLTLIQKWMVETGIRFGIDGNQRQGAIGIAEEEGTFECGFDRLLESLAIGDLVSFTEAELLGDWIETTRALYESRPNGIRTMAEWVDYLRTICIDFFTESEEQLWFFRKLEALRQVEEMPFEPFLLLLEEELKGEGLTIHPNQLQTYRFSSMLPMRSIPAKVIWLLGMDQDSFPRIDRRFSFDLSQKSHTYSPSRVDFDRYLFLESILSAREYFIVSMIGRDPLDNQERPPSSCVSDLLEHVHVTPKEHAAKSYEIPTNQIEYEMALAAREKKEILAPFICCKAEKSLPEVTLDLSQLMRLARSPIAHFFEERLGLHFFQETSIKDEEEFLLSPLTFAKLKSDTLKSSLDDAIKRVKRRGEYPWGLFGKIADAKCSTIQEVETYSIEWHEHVKAKTQIDERLWYYPAIQCGLVTIVGRVDGIKKDTLQIPKKADLRNVLAHFPYLLLFDEVQFVDKKIALDEPLEPFLRYFFEAQKTVSPLFPTWIKPIIEKNGAELEKQMAAPTFDPAWSWYRLGHVFSTEQLIDSWQSKAQQLFGGVINGWF